MFKRTKEENYFDLFAQGAEYSQKAAEALLELMSNYTDVETKAEAIHDIEHQGDFHFHKLYNQLMTSFITPIEREDILLLASKIDDITDLVEDIAYRFVMFDIKTIREDSIPMAELLVEAITLVQITLVKFKNFAKSKTINDKIREISDVEERGDRMYKNAVRNLFKTSNDPIEIMKWREIYHKMEMCIDSCEDVADAMHGVIIKNS